MRVRSSASHLRHRASHAGLLAAAALTTLAACERTEGPGTPDDAPAAGVVRLSGDVDPMAVAVMPFGVRGADTAVHHLRETLREYVASAIRGGNLAEGDFDAETTLEARRQALEAGAGLVLTGSVVGRPEQLTVRGTILRTRSGRTLFDETVGGTLEEIPAMAKRLVLQLYLGGADPATRQAIASAPLPLIDSTLEGWVMFTHGRDFRVAAERFDAALAIDSTFGPAVWGLYRSATQWGSAVARSRVPEAVALMQSNYERLPAPGRVWWDLQENRNSSRASRGREMLALYEEAARASPNDALIWNRVFYLYWYDGAYMGIEDWERRAREAKRQQAEILDWEVDCEGLLHLLIRQVEPDPTELESYREHCPGENWLTRRIRASILRDTAELRRLHEQYASAGSGGLPVLFISYVVLPGFPIDEWESLLDTADRNTSTRGQRFTVTKERFYRAQIIGRPSRAMELLGDLMAEDQGVEPWQADVNPWFFVTLPIVNALLEPGWEDASAESVTRLENPDPAWGDTLSDGHWNSSFDRVCYSELGRITRGDITRTRRSVAVLRRLRDSLFVPRRELSCPELLDALWERSSSTTGTGALARLDSLMRLAPLANVNNHLDQKLTNLLLARMYWARGDTASAWHWVRRRPYRRMTGDLIHAWIRSEARFAVAVGDHDHAIRAYRHYLMLREDPEPVLVPQRDSVRAELACIDPELADRRDPAVCAELLGDGR